MLEWSPHTEEIDQKEKDMKVIDILNILKMECEHKYGLHIKNESAGFSLLYKNNTDKTLLIDEEVTESEVKTVVIHEDASITIHCK